MLVAGLGRGGQEHARRLLRLLQLRGVAVTGLWFEDEGHSFESLPNTQRMWRGIAGFLRQHLDTPE